MNPYSSGVRGARKAFMMVAGSAAMVTTLAGLHTGLIILHDRPAANDIFTPIKSVVQASPLFDGGKPFAAYTAATAYGLAAGLMSCSFMVGMIWRDEKRWVRRSERSRPALKP